MVDGFLWWLALALIGWAAFPLGFFFFRWLPDRGYAFSRVFGLVVLSYVLWVGGYAHVLPYERGTVIGLLAAMALASAWLVRSRPDIRTFLREKRALVASTFGYLVPPLHASIVGLLVFIINVLGLFSTTLLQSAPDSELLSGTGNTAATSAAASMGAFTSLNLEFLNLLVMTVAIVLTFGNAMVTSLVSGGHRLRMGSSFGLMCLISGFLMAVLPGAAASIFETITATP